MKKRLLSILTALALCLGLLPAPAFAAESAGPCRHHRSHTAECGYIAPTAGSPCTHEHTAECYALGVYAVAEDTGNPLVCGHVHDDACGYVPAGPGHPCGYECHICPVQNLIDALPDADAITADSADAVKAQLTEIDAAKAALTDEERDALDAARYVSAVSVLQALEGRKGANTPELLAETVGAFTVTGGTQGTDYTFDDTSGVLTVLTGTALTISGTSNSNRIEVSSGVSANITLSGVNIDVSGTSNAAAFKIADNSTGNVTVTLADGTANTLKSGSSYAGLQKKSVGEDAGTLTIQCESFGEGHVCGSSCGSLDASSSSSSAGIGGGGHTSNITINGGNIKATGYLNGAGIGGGYDRDADHIAINGGNITAIGGDFGAGIGGGGYGNARNISITGGTVTATGGTFCAGIGGGQGSQGSSSKGSADHITITGGTVTATGGTYGAGIGGGQFGSGTNITISGGTVTANSGGNYGAAGIGKGYYYGCSSTFSTGVDGHAFIITNGISDMSGYKNGDWNAVIILEGDGLVCGSVTLPAGSYTVPGSATLTIPDGQSLTIGKGASLSVESDATLTNNGTLTIAHGGALTSDPLEGSGTFRTGNLTDEMIAVPAGLVYDGADPPQAIEAQTELNPLTLFGKAFQADTTDWVCSVTKNSDTRYTVAYTHKSGDRISREAAVGQSGTAVDVKAGADAYTYGETVTVTATASPTGEAPASRLRGAPAAGEMALCYGDTQVSEAAAMGQDGRYTMTVPVKDLIAAGAQYGTVTLTAKFKGTSLMADGEGSVDVTLKPAALTVTGITGTTAKVYDGTTACDGSGLALTASGALDGDDVTAAANVYTYDDANAGENKTVAANGFTTVGADADNYCIAGDQGDVSAPVGVITKAPALTPAPGTLAVQNRQARTYTYDLSRLLPVPEEGRSLGTVSYALGAVHVTGGYYAAGAEIEGSVLTLPIQAVDTEAEGQIGEISVTITSQNYADMTAAIQVSSDNRGPVPVTGVRLNKYSLTLRAGESEPLTAAVAPDDAYDTGVTWASSDPAVATVDANGTVTAAKAGTAAITVTTRDGSYTASCTVTVTAPQYTVTYNANGGGGTMGGGTATDGVAFVLPGCGFTPPAGKVFDAWAVGSAGGQLVKAGADCIFTGDTTLCAIWKDAPAVTYAVTYSANGGSGSMGGGAAPAEDAFVLPGCGFTPPAGKVFDAWAVGSAGGPRVNAGESYTFTGNTTLYALWKDLPYNITGTITQNGQKIAGVTVLLKQGSTVIARQSTDENGNYTFTDVTSGIYNLVAEKDGITKTVMQEITSSSAELTTPLPAEKTNSVVEIMGDTPPVVVGELETLFDDAALYTAGDKAVAAAGGTVEFKLKVEKQENPPADLIEAIQSASHTAGLVLDLTITKTVTAASGTETKVIDEVSSLIETLVPLPAELQGKASYTVYREHNGKAEALPNSGSGERYEVSADKTTITIFARKYSTYAIAWSDTPAPVEPGQPVNPPSGGGFIVNSSHAVTVAASEHGKVTASRASAASGSTVTLTVAPDSGYALDALTVTDSQGGEIKLTAKGDGKYTFTMPGRAVTVKAAFAPVADVPEAPTATEEETDCPSLGFTDLDAGAWYHEAVDFALRNGLMGGYKNGTFGPNDNLSRAQLAQILYNQAGQPAATGASPFTDAASGAWYTDAITWAAAQGVVGGYGNGLFGPDDDITREQLAVMLWRHAGSPAATEKELHFSDAGQAHGYALDALRWAVENGILTGYGDGRLDPRGLAARAEAAQMLMRYLKETQN